MRLTGKREKYRHDTLDLRRLKKEPGHINRDCPENSSQTGKSWGDYGKRSRQWGPDPDAKRSREHQYSRSNCTRPKNLSARQVLSANNTPRNNATGVQLS